MRVVAGTLRGRKLVAPEGLNVRPTAERVRQATFNALDYRSAVRGARVVDLFAGTGALGIEAISRGAVHVTFVEHDKAALACLRTNVDHLGLSAQVSIVRADVSRFLMGGLPPVDLLIADPPYEFDGWVDLLARSVVALQRPHPDDRGIIVLETPGLIDVGPAWEVIRQQRYGGTVVTLAIPAPMPDPIPEPVLEPTPMLAPTPGPGHMPIPPTAVSQEPT